MIQQMNGVINIFKEKGYTSFHVVYWIRKITGEQKVGHTGTLDPDVTGVLPICIGKATKLVGQLTDTDKTYRCRMRFGCCTDTQDMSGQVTERMEEDEVRRVLLGQGPFADTDIDTATEHDGYDRSCSKILDAIGSFVGEISQVPPMFSALKVGGMKLVNAARKGVVVEREPRKVTIHSIEDVQISEDLLHVQFTVRCSKGTYVRTLCEDIGRRLGVPACMEELERTQAAGLSLDTAVTLEQVKELAAAGRLQECVISTDAFLMVYPSLTVTDEAVKKLIYGNYLYDTDIAEGAADDPDTHCFRICDRQGRFYALYRYDKRADCYKCVKMFRDPGEE